MACPNIPPPSMLGLATLNLDRLVTDDTQYTQHYVCPSIARNAKQPMEAAFPHSRLKAAVVYGRCVNRPYWTAYNSIMQADMESISSRPGYRFKNLNCR